VSKNRRTCDMNEVGWDMEEQLSSDQLTDEAFEGEIGKAMDGMDCLDIMDGGPWNTAVNAF
jgi:hypothetical protein